MRCSCGVVGCGVVFCEDPRSVVGVQDQDRVHGEEGHRGRHDCGDFVELEEGRGAMWRRSYQIVESGQSVLWPHNSGIIAGPLHF